MVLWLWLACIEGRAPVEVPMYVDPSGSRIALDGGVLTLTRAELTMADVRLESPPDDVAFFPPTLGSPFPAAHAHPGHDFAGSIRGELLGVWTVDLLGDPTQLGVVNGYEGDVLTSRIELQRLSLEGTLQPTDRPAADVAVEIVVDRPVSGVDADLHLEPGVDPLHLTVDLARILSFVEADDVLGNGLDPVALDNALVFGLTTADAYALRLSP